MNANAHYRAYIYYLRQQDGDVIVVSVLCVILSNESISLKQAY